VETLWRVSRALRVSLGSLLAPAHEPRTRLVRAREGTPLHADSGMSAWLLHAAGREQRSEVFDCELPKGTDQRTDAHLPGTEELVVCLRGRVRVGPVGEEAVLAAGDALWFRADVAHHYEALRDSRTLCIMLYTGA
jgi:quercetin dioxygenase-like cupin family protein